MTFGTGVLQVGSTGPGVTELQQWLIDRGFLIAAAGPPATNRYGAIQIEIIGFAANSAALATAEPDTFSELGRLMRWIETNATPTGIRASSTSPCFSRFPTPSRPLRHCFPGTPRRSSPRPRTAAGWICRSRKGP